MKISRPLLTIVVVIAIVVVSCSKIPSGILGKEKMARIIADLSIAEAVVESDYRTYAEDSTKLALKQSVFAKNHVTPEQVDTSLKWYGRNMDILVEVYDRAIEMTEEDLKQSALNSTTSSPSKPTSIYATEGDSVDLWTAPHSRVFAANMPANISTFYTVNDRNWQNGDIFTLAGKTHGAIRPVLFSITVEYKDGTKEYVTSSASGNGWERLRLPLNPDKAASMVYGYIMYTPDSNEVVALDSISLIRTRAGSGSENLRRKVSSFASDYEHLH
ncbi:MAG: DUF4296 domain-containing protein [Paramuribaculum sp.]|nr:DUF4296 domain-containing protein [Paramuribaculum sp.]